MAISKHRQNRAANLGQGGKGYSVFGGVSTNLLYRMALRMGPEPRKQAKERKPHGRIRITDEQVVEMRTHYERHGGLKEFIAAHPDWPWPPKSKSAWNWVRRVVAYEARVIRRKK